MEVDRFKIIFEKLAEASPSIDTQASESEEMYREFDEISELRRLAAEVSETEPVTYTST